MSNRLKGKAIVDIGGGTPAITWFWFLGAGGAATLTGFFVDMNGVRIGSSFSLSVPAGDGSNNPVSFNEVTGGVPDGAYGFIGRVVTTAVHFDVVTTASYSADFKTNYANYPSMATSGATIIGRVSAPGA